jgi:hypothetical protein
MRKSPHDLTVFVSSTSTDLEDYRAVARNVVLDMLWKPVMMEHFSPQSERTVDSCRHAIEECDVMLLLVAWRQGWMPTPEQGGNGRDSITMFELEHARSRQIPVLVLVANEAWPGNLWEEDATKRQWVRQFRENINQVFAFFEHEPAASRESERLPRFRAIIKQTLLTHKERLLAPAGGGGATLDFFNSARDGLLEGTDIPVIGGGVFNTGALGPQALARALLQHRDAVPDALLQAQLPLATAAEYRERFDGREPFLRRYRKILERQSSEAAAPPVVQLLAQLPSIAVMVSATNDRILEMELEKAGRRYITVAHVLRSAEGEKNGSLLVRRGTEVTFCRADELRLRADECVIYKPQGSPFLHDDLDPDLEIDTVVVTETDHAIFLQRLESPETGVPGPVKSRLRRSPLLFLGYTMDVWQYRLMMLLFQSVRRQDGLTTRAVRIPDTDVEEVAWNRLNASVIRMDPNEFARSVLSPAKMPC